MRPSFLLRVPSLKKSGLKSCYCFWLRLEKHTFKWDYLFTVWRVRALRPIRLSWLFYLSCLFMNAHMHNRNILTGENSSFYGFVDLFRFIPLTGCFVFGWDLWLLCSPYSVRSSVLSVACSLKLLEFVFWALYIYIYIYFAEKWIHYEREYLKQPLSKIPIKKKKKLPQFHH